MQRLKGTINVLVPNGALGMGLNEADVMAAVSEAHAIACDAGSTDSGPAYLSTGLAKYSRGAVKTDLAALMRAQAKSGVPLLIGSCGTSGCDAAVDWMVEIAREIAAEEGISPRIRALYSEQSPAEIARRAAAGEVQPLAPMDSAEPDLFLSCDRVVALMGPEPYMAAIEAGADIVLGGRTTDTAVLSAMPLLRGADVGASWHAAKIAECGALCTVRPRDGGVMIRIGGDGFEVEPLSAGNRCTPRTVSAHMLYENSDPFHLYEPGGMLDVTDARYRAVDERVVQVTGSRFVRQPYTMKLEGASAAGYQTMMLVGIQDRAVLKEIDRFVRQMHDFLVERVSIAMKLPRESYEISLRPYGWNAVDGLPPPGAEVPREIGLMFVVTAATQTLATEIAKTCNPWFFHMPLNPESELPSYAFPFSPAEVEKGRVYEFRLNHIVNVARPDELVRVADLVAGAR